jgi:26S proteasome regulatory subunit N12
MAERTLQQLLQTLKSQGASLPYAESTALLSKAKLALLQLKALTPTPSTPQNHLALARETYEQGALVSIRNRKTDPFTRYVQQLQPFYELPASSLPPNLPERNKVTGLYLLLLLTQGRYSEFHSELESLAIREGGGEGSAVEDDRYLGYPIKLERWLMEGSYDRVWKAMKNREVPSEEYGVFSEVCSVLRTSRLLTPTDVNTDPHIPDPLRDRLELRARLPQPAH